MSAMPYIVHIYEKPLDDEPLMSIPAEDQDAAVRIVDSMHAGGTTAFSIGTLPDGV